MGNNPFGELLHFLPQACSPVSVVSMLAAAALAACAPATLQAPQDLVLMAVWTVPSGTFRRGEPGSIQVRLTPKIIMDEAVLRLRAEDPRLVFTGADRTTYKKLRPPEAPKEEPRKPGEPPALGLTLVSNFPVVAREPGRYEVTIEFVFQDKIQSSRIFINVSP